MLRWPTFVLLRTRHRPRLRCHVEHCEDTLVAGAINEASASSDPLDNTAGMAGAATCLSGEPPRGCSART